MRPIDLPDLPAAACAGEDGEAWFTPHRGLRQAAARICGSCPERQPCLAWAITHRIRYGTWGGVTLDRPDYRTQRTRQAHPRAVAAGDDELAQTNPVPAAEAG